VSGEPSLSDITALDIIEHLNELLAFLMAENRELERTIAQRDRKIELLLAADRAQRKPEGR
jgi:hypothetical protein